MPPQQHWIEEGIATDVEPVAREQVGQLSAAYVWKQFILDMPKGEPGPRRKHTAKWSVETAFGVGDEATGVDVLRSLYYQMRDKPVRVNLADLWGRLGVALNDGQVEFNDRAVDAPIRHAILSQ